MARRIDYESVADSITVLKAEISMARDGDFDDVLDVCQSLLNLIERINERECGE